MINSVDWSQIQIAMSTARGWTELGIVAVCLGIAWLVDRRVWRVREDKTRPHRLVGSFARVVFPLTAMALLGVARAVMHRRGSPTFFIDIALPMMLALVAIRVVVYGLRRVFRNAAWLKTSERAVAFAIWGVLILHFTGVLPEIAGELDSIDIPLGKSDITLWSVLTSTFAVIATLIVTLWISGLVEQRVMKAAFDVNLRVVLSKVLRAVLLVAGVFIALETVGFDLTLLTVFGGALGVGIGLGLQKLASNYVSGFAILLDRSIRMNDTVTVADRKGVVSRLTARYVVVRDVDGVESIIPNEMIVTSIVLRHPAASEMRLALPVQIAFDADIARALALMEQAAARDPRVRTGDNPPKALLGGFGDYGIRVELGIWVGGTENAKVRDDIRSTVNEAVLAAFRSGGIELAQPPRGPNIVETGTKPATSSPS